MSLTSGKFNSYCQEFLLSEFNRRKEQNPSYSIRAFARDIGIGKTNVSAVLQGMRRLSRTNIDILAEKLHLDEETVKRFRDDITRVRAEEKNLLVKEWYFKAIINLSNISDNHFDSKWVAERLAIPLDTADYALKILTEKRLIENANGRISIPA